MGRGRIRGCGGKRARAHLLAFTWGFAEGTAFFIVPDVWLSRMALDDAGEARRASFSALAGALLGGVLVHAWGRRVPARTSRDALLRVPAITPEMVERVEAELERGMHTMVRGPLQGIPYKIYARTAGMTGVPLGRFLLWSIPARLPRFLLLVVGTQAAARAGRRAVGNRPALERILHAAGWGAFYTWYFNHTGFFTWTSRRATSAISPDR